MERLTWRKSSYRSDVGDYVEIADLDEGGRAVRDSKDSAGPALAVIPA